jgi:hypothetical protein
LAGGLADRNSIHGFPFVLFVLLTRSARDCQISEANGQAGTHEQSFYILERQTMSIIRVNKNANYFTASNEVFNDARLSWEARGLMGYLLSKPDDWQVRMADLETKGPAGREKLRNMLRELSIAGYVRRMRVHSTTGTWLWVTEVYETRQNDMQETTEAPMPIGGFAVDGLPVDGLPIDGKPVDVLSTKEELNTELIKSAPENGAVLKNDLPLPPGSSGWPGDIRELATSFAKKFGRDPINGEKGRWIKSLRQDYLKLGITPAELERAYDLCKKEGLSIKSPASIFFKADELHRGQPMPVVEGVGEDGAKLIRYPNGVLVREYGA